MAKKSKIKTLTKSDISDKLFQFLGYSKRRCAKYVDMMFNIMRAQLRSGNQLKLSKFGNFILKDKKARRGRDPQTGEEITIKKRRVVTFHPSPVLKNMVNKKRRRLW